MFSKLAHSMNSKAQTRIATLLIAMKFLIAASSGRQWFSSRDSLSDYEAVGWFRLRTVIECLIVGNRDSAVQMVTFSDGSGLCTHFRCRLGLSHCRKCRNVDQGDQRVWVTDKDCWTTVQHRVSGSVDFYRNWSDYQSGFGEGLHGNYWMGLDSLHAMTLTGIRKVRFLMKPWNDSQSWAEYPSVSIGPETDKYRLNVSGFSASPGIGDCFAFGNKRQFSTKDADHDMRNGNCAEIFFGAWWFDNCHCTHPNGVFKESSIAIGGLYAQGIIWGMDFGYHYSLAEFEMLIM